MKKILTSIITTITLTLWQHIAFAATDITTGTKATAADTKQQKRKIPYIYCPPVNVIKQNPISRTWYAHTPEGFWKSYQLSFATNLTQFVGAQWVGENIGQIFCVYKSEQRLRLQGVMQTETTIPVTLAFSVIAPVPKKGTGAWTHPKRGVRDCHSLQQSDCPFLMNTRKKQGNLFQEAESLKYK